MRSLSPGQMLSCAYDVHMYQLTTEHPGHYSPLRGLVPDASKRAQLLRVPKALIEAIDAGQAHSRQALPAARVRLVCETLEELSGRLRGTDEACDFLLAGNYLSKLLQNGGRDHQASLIESVRA